MEGVQLAGAAELPVLHRPGDWYASLNGIRRFVLNLKKCRLGRDFADDCLDRRKVGTADFQYDPLRLNRQERQSLTSVSPVFDDKNPFTDLTDAFPQAVFSVGVLGFGPTGASSIHSVFPNSHSPIDQLILTNATNPYVTFFFIGSELAYNSPDAVPAGFFSVGEPVDLQALVPTSDGSKPPDLSVVHNQPAIPLGVDNSFPVQQILHSGDNIPLTSSISGTKPGNAVAILATTSSFNLAPQIVTAAIYSQVKEAAFDQQTGLWHVPCGTQLTTEVVIANSTIVMENESLVIHLPGTSQCVGSVCHSALPAGNCSFVETCCDLV